MSEKIHVRFKENLLIWLKDDDGSGALAPLHHVDMDGNVKLECVFEDSYAHVFEDGSIMRYGQIIGEISDLEFLPDRPRC